VPLLVNVSEGIGMRGAFLRVFDAAVWLSASVPFSSERTLGNVRTHQEHMISSDTRTDRACKDDARDANSIFTTLLSSHEGFSRSRGLTLIQPDNQYCRLQHQIFSDRKI
jgi:hypothetical protein